MNNSGNQPHNNLETWRLFGFIIVLGLILVVFIGRLFTLQIIQGDQYVGDAEENRTEVLSLRTQRGVIYDRNGIVLARNIAAYNIAITPALMPEDLGEQNRILRELSAYTEKPISFDELF